MPWRKQRNITKNNDYTIFDIKMYKNAKAKHSLIPKIKIVLELNMCINMKWRIWGWTSTGSQQEKIEKTIKRETIKIIFFCGQQATLYCRNKTTWEERNKKEKEIRNYEIRNLYAHPHKKPDIMKAWCKKAAWINPKKLKYRAPIRDRDREQYTICVLQTTQQPPVNRI